MKKRVGLGVMVCVTAGIVWAAGDWSEAQRRVETFRREHQELKRMTPQETREIVKAICEEAEATDDRKEKGETRRTVGRRVAERVKSDVKNAYDRLESTKKDAIKLLDDVLSDDKLSSNRSDAQRMKDEVNERWGQIDRMSAAIRGGNHPVVALMSDQGIKVHRERQGNCDAAEFELESGIADCIMASGETCKVIELKPDNRRALNRGSDQVRAYVKSLNTALTNNDSKVLDRLRSKDSDFVRCKSFVGQVDCYRACPTINDEGEINQVSVSWRTDC